MSLDIINRVPNLKEVSTIDENNSIDWIYQ